MAAAAKKSAPSDFDPKTGLPKADAVTAEAPAKKADNLDEITYLPEEGDPIRTRWGGIEFKAHVPVKVSRATIIQTLERVTSELPDGQIVSRSIEKRTPLVELAKNNCRFMVNGVPPQVRASGETITPETSDQYRGYAMSWIAGSTSPSAMDARWAAEEMLRIKCGVDDRDIAYLRPFFEARHGAVGGGSQRPQREILMGLTREELALEAQRAR